MNKQCIFYSNLFILKNLILQFCSCIYSFLIKVHGFVRIFTTYLDKKKLKYFKCIYPVKRKNGMAFYSFIACKSEKGSEKQTKIAQPYKNPILVLVASGMRIRPSYLHLSVAPFTRLWSRTACCAG